MRNHKIIYLIMSIVIVIAILLSSTFAFFGQQFFSDKNTNYQTGMASFEINPDSGSEMISLQGSIPISDAEGILTQEYSYTLKNTGNLIYSLDLKLVPDVEYAASHGCSDKLISTSAIKIQINGGSPVLLSSLTDGKILSNTMLSPGTISKIRFRIWLDNNASNAEINKHFHGKLVVDGKAISTSTANPPVLHGGMIPVKWNGSAWVKADETNPNNEWYDYANKKWANIVLITNAKRANYQTAAVNTVITEADIQMYFVWIPRFKYKLWNVEFNSVTPREIEIEFETGVNDSGIVNCSTNPTTGIETCTNKVNGNWYTHPGFDYQDSTGKEQTGFWIGKFTVTGSYSAPTIKPGLTVMYSTMLNESNGATQYMPTTNYFDTGGITTANPRMAKNTEWAAMAYLAYSKYGRCNGTGSCETIVWNNSSSYYTGRVGINNTTGDIVITSLAAGTTTYDTTHGVKGSTTGNIYGVYDTVGGAFEYVYNNMVNAAGNAYYSYGSSGFNTTTMPFVDCGTYKIDCYPYSTSNTVFTNSKLGDGVGETRGFGGNINFVYTSSYFFMKSYYYGAYANTGLFSNYIYNGGSASGYGTRYVITKK